MEERDYIKDLFSEKLSKHEAPVRDALWNSISSQIVSKTLVKTGLSLASKIIIGISAASVVAVVSFVVINSASESQEVKLVSSPTEEVKKDLDKIEEKVVFVEESKTLIKESNTIKDVPKINEVESTKVIKNQKGKEELINLNVHQTKNIVEVKEDSKIGTVATQITSKDLTIEEKREENKVVNTTKTEAVEKETIVKPAKIGNLPNFFSPNNDRDNDYFFIELEGLTDFSLIVLDKTNTKVFTSNDLNFKWDGRDFQNTLVPVGSYVYFFTGKDPQGNVISKSNTLVVKY